MARQPIYAVLSWAESLAQIIGGYHVDGGPGQPGPILSRDMAHLIAGGIIREVARHIQEPRQAEMTRKSGLELARRGSSGLIEGYNGDGPPWVDLPWPLPWPPKKFDPKASVFEGVKPGSLDPLLTSVAQRLADLVSRLPATR